MAIRQMAFATLGAAVLALSACSKSDTPILMNARASHSGPDEFSILPTKPLEMPTNLAALPSPNPGGTNRVDPQPRADVARALGGSPVVALTGGTADGGIVNHASRFGRDSGIRGQLAAEDLAHREKNQGRLLERLFAVNVYNKAYEFMSLDKYAELERWRRTGVRTPTAPPPKE
jgi:hypothetical protein